ncbi:MAG: hypothetical protein QNJ90_07445 [Planctomycetota bacterium]|nr:hypothetical protein [Planctomycetota bacterium]
MSARAYALPHAVKALFLALLLASCGSGSDGAAPDVGDNPGDDPTPVAAQADVPFALSIQVPTPLPSHVTSDATIAIEGTCLGEPDTMTWANGAGGSGAVPTAEAWQVQVPLQPGPNRIVIEARRDGETQTDEILVVRDAAVIEVSPLEVRPSGVLVGQTRTITVRTLIHLQETPTSVELHRVELGGQPIEKLADLRDDGDTGRGDEFADDYVYSGQFDFTASAAGPTWLMARIEHPGGTLWSPLELLAAATPIDAGDVQAAEASMQAASQAYLAGSDHEAGVTAALAVLQTDPNVVQSGRAGGMGGIWMIYDSGIAAGLLLTPDGLRGGGSDCDVRMETSAAWLQAYFLNDANNEIPFLHAEFEDKTCTDWFPNDKVEGTSVTIAQLKLAGQRGIFGIATHGDSWYEGIVVNAAIENSPDLFGVYNGLAGTGEAEALNRKVSITQAAPVLLTNQRLDVDDAVTLYGEDIAHGRIVFTAAPRGDGTVKLAVTPHFVNEYICIPDGIVYLGSCRSMFNTKLADAFIARGAKAVFGFDDYVLSTFCEDRSKALFGKLCEGQTILEAWAASGPFEQAPSQFGQYWAYPTWKAVFAPDGFDKRLPLDGIQNPSFEKGKLFWATQSAHVASRMGDIRPHNRATCNTRFLVLQDLASAGQSICVPEDVTTLSFRYNIVGAAMDEVCGDNFIGDYYFRAEIGNETPVDITLTDLCGSPDLQLVDAGINDDWDGITRMTGWVDVRVDISAYQGERMTIRFVTDALDLALPMAVLIDDVRLGGP